MSTPAPTGRIRAAIHGMRSPALLAACLLPSLLFMASASLHTAIADDSETALANWEKVYEVFSHPRCANCHVPADNRPRWSGPSYGETRAHGMNIKAADAASSEPRSGTEALPCATCHAAQNSPVPHGPPGAHDWALAPLDMLWWQQSSAEICEQIKDPNRNGSRTLEAIAQHIADDELVHWGWAPGPGREPAPYSADEVVGFLRFWAAEGAPCP